MKNTCKQCNLNFNITEHEILFLKKIAPQVDSEIIELPLPELCPGCREQSRIVFRNELNFFKRKCDKTKKEIISIYDENSPYIIYDSSVWWSDLYNPLDYGRDFDFSRSFFEQFHELNLSVPKVAIQNAKSENSQYTNYSAENKNCYICSGSSFNEDCYYSSRVTNSKFICDSYNLNKSENCYGCINSSMLYNCAYSKDCHSSSNLYYCDNCIGCHDCIACNDLQGCKFYILNKQYTESEFKIKKIDFLNKARDKNFTTNNLTTKRTEYIVGCENSTGNQLYNCSNCNSCFALKESQDCLYVGAGTNNKDSVDSNFMDKNELIYYSTNLIGDYNLLFGAYVWYTSESMYLVNCLHSNNLFGCSGMKKNEYCIFNKQFSKVDYYIMLKKIINHMQETKEWGRFFPSFISPFPYNLTVAQDYYPLTKAVALERKYKWLDQITNSEDKNLNLDGVKVCSITGKAFKILKQEKDICEKLEISLPNKCPEVRRNELTKDIKRAISNFI